MVRPESQRPDGQTEVTSLDSGPLGGGEAEGGVARQLSPHLGPPGQPSNCHLSSQVSMADFFMVSDRGAVPVVGAGCPGQPGEGAGGPLGCWQGSMSQSKSSSGTAKGRSSREPSGPLPTPQSGGLRRCGVDRTADSP